MGATVKKNRPATETLLDAMTAGGTLLVVTGGVAVIESAGLAPGWRHLAAAAVGVAAFAYLRAVRGLRVLWWTASLRKAVREIPAVGGSHRATPGLVTVRAYNRGGMPSVLAALTAANDHNAAEIRGWYDAMDDRQKIATAIAFRNVAETILEMCKDPQPGDTPRDREVKRITGAVARFALVRLDEMLIDTVRAEVGPGSGQH